MLLAAALLAGCGGTSAGDTTSSSGRTSAGPFRAHVRFADAAGTRIAYYERGQGPPLAMLMGTASTMSEWDPALLRLLARDHRLVLFDYPGIGLSGPWHGRGFDSLADATAALMDAIHLRRAGILGWSMGGFVAQRLAIRHPARVSRLVLAGTNPGGDRTVLGTRRAQEIDSEPHPSEAQILGELYPPNRQGAARRFVRRLARAARGGEIPDDFQVPAATARAQVRELKARGDDFVKVYSMLPAEAYFAAVAEAKAVGLPVAGHLPYTVSAAQASDAGQRTLEQVFLEIVGADRDGSAGTRAPEELSWLR